MTNSATAVTTSTQPTNLYSVPYYQQRPGYNYWPYSVSQTPYPQYTYPYGGYYTNISVNGTTQSTYGYGQYRSGQLQWQQPYQGPRQGPTLVSAQVTASTSVNVQPVEGSQMESSSDDLEKGQPNQVSVTTSASTVTGEGGGSATSPGIIPLQKTNAESVSVSIHSVQISSNDGSASDSTPEQPSVDLTNPSIHADPGSTAAEGDSQVQFTLTPEMEQAILRNLQALSTMSEAQLAELLQGNPQLKPLLAVLHPSKPAES